MEPSSELARVPLSPLTMDACMRTGERGKSSARRFVVTCGIAAVLEGTARASLLRFGADLLCAEFCPSFAKIELARITICWAVGAPGSRLHSASFIAISRVASSLTRKGTYLD